MADRESPVRLAEVVGLFALGQDNAFGQPLGSQQRACAIAMVFADRLGLGPGEMSTVYWVSQLRFIGCTGHAHEVAAVFGDDVATRSRAAVADLSDPRQLLPEIVLHAGDGHPLTGRVRSVLAMLAGGRSYMTLNFRAACEVGDALLARLGMSAPVCQALRNTLEQWNGRGLPDGRRATEIPLEMRIVRLCQDAEALARIRGDDVAWDVIGRRSGRVYDPELVAEFRVAGPELLCAIEDADPWDVALDAEPAPHRLIAGADLDRALQVLADFTDLKSAFTAGHSRGVAELAAAAAVSMGLHEAEVTTLRRAGWVHDVGRTSIPNSIWDKPGPLSRAEVDRVQLHPMLGEQMLRRCRGLESIATVAGLHHERLDGSGYVRGLPAAGQSLPARILAVADRYSDLVEPRAYRAALAPGEAAEQIRQRVALGRLDGRAAEAVLTAAGHQSRRPARDPTGLTGREVEVLRLAVQGLTVRQIGSRLVIAPKTVDRHIQHIYAKAGVSTRGALALFAVERGLLTPAG